MKHISRSTFTGRADNGEFLMPVTLHITFCKQTVRAEEIDNQKPSCDICIDNRCWEMIDFQGGN